MKGSLSFRKLLSSFVSAFLISMLITLSAMLSMGFSGFIFVVWTFIYMIYAGLIILTFGNLVSLVIEFLFKRWRNKNILSYSLYILLHAIFGYMAGVLLSDTYEFVLYGTAAASIYAIADEWLFYRIKNNKKVAALPVSVVISFIMLVILSSLLGYIF